MVFNRFSCRDLDSNIRCEWLPRDLVEVYVKGDVRLPTEYDDAFVRLWAWPYESNPVGHAGMRLREVFTEVECTTNPTSRSFWPSRLSAFVPPGAGAGIGALPGALFRTPSLKGLSKFAIP